MTPKKQSGSTDYRSAGVDVTKGEEAVRRIKKHVEGTFTDAVLRGVGSFAGAIDAAAIKKLDDPVLLASIDGVGTKTVIAEQANKWDGIGKDIVHHSANDLVCQGATPLLFLDYVASASLQPDVLEIIVQGMSEACRDLGCVLIGGETAEMPQVYAEGAHDVVGSIIGVASRAKMITGDTIAEGDALIALPSNGLHTNGYSLARKALQDCMTDDVVDQLLAPHTLYVQTVLKLHEEFGLKGVAHITGGGIRGNLSRILPEGLGTTIEKRLIQTPQIFSLIQEKGNIAEEAMYEAFNMGVGMILVAEQSQADNICAQAKGSYVIGNITQASDIIIL